MGHQISPTYRRNQVEPDNGKIIAGCGWSVITILACLGVLFFIALILL